VRPRKIYTATDKIQNKITLQQIVEIYSNILVMKDLSLFIFGVPDAFAWNGVVILYITSAKL
jgi:hypothetical protein